MTPDRPTAQRTTDRILNGTSAAFDWLDAHWNSTATRRATGTVLVTIFVAVLAAAEIARRGWLPESALRFAPRSHFVAVSLVFSFLLVLEVAGLVIALAQSVASSVGKQFELLALILIREVFVELGNAGEPLASSGLRKNSLFRWCEGS